MAEEGTGGRGRGEREGRRKGPERKGEGRKREGPHDTLAWGPQCLNPALLATGHSPSLVLRCGTVCRPTFDLHQHSVLSTIGSRLICFYSRILYFDFHQLNSSSVCCTAPLYSDFTDMLRRLINCRIIIIITTTTATTTTTTTSNYCYCCYYYY